MKKNWALLEKAMTQEVARWKEVSHTEEGQEDAGRRGGHLGQKVQRKSEKRIRSPCQLASVRKTDDHTRATVMRGLRRLRQIREEEEEAAKELLEEVQDRKQQL